MRAHGDGGAFAAAAGFAPQAANERFGDAADFRLRARAREIDFDGLVAERAAFGDSDSPRRKRAGAARGERAINIERVGDSASVLPGRAAEAIEQKTARVAPARDGDFANRGGHIFDRDGDERIGERGQIGARGGRQTAGDFGERGRGRFFVEIRIAARPENRRKKPRPQFSQNDIAIGYRRRAAAAVSRGAGAGAGGLRPDRQPPVDDARQRTAPGGDGVDCNHRREQPRAADFVFDLAREAAVATANIGRSPAHIEADRARGAGGGRRHRAPGGAGKNRVFGAHFFGGDERARRLH